jgi:hypothetical protein
MAVQQAQPDMVNTGLFSPENVFPDSNEDINKGGDRSANDSQLSPSIGGTSNSPITIAASEDCNSVHYGTKLPTHETSPSEKFSLTNTPSTIPSGQESSGLEARPWEATFLRLGPLSGILALLTAILSILASLGILAGSNGEETNSWPVEPSIYLAIFTALANLAMRYV